MIRRVATNAIPPKRGVSAVTKKVMMEFQSLQKELEKNPLAPYQAELVVLDIPSKKPNAVKHATMKLFALTKEHVEAKRLPYKVFTRNSGTELYVANMAGQAA